MNAPIPLNATSQPNPSASGERGIDRLFGELEALYGSKFADLWAGTDIERVKAKWTEKLRGFAEHPGVIQKAVDALDESPTPPTLPEFLGLCRDAAKRMWPVNQALPYKPSAEDEERFRRAVASAAKVVEKINSDCIEVHWATHPKTPDHLRYIFDAAKRNKRFVPCIAEMVKNGICTADGHLIKLYRDQQW